MKLLIFLFNLVIVLVISTSILPLLPWYLAPNLLVIIIVVTYIENDLNTMIKWAIWGGLGLDLLSINHFGLYWIPILVSAGFLYFIRFIFTAKNFPFLWPLLFAVSTVITESIIAIQNQEWLQWGLITFTTTIWGMIFVIGYNWWRASRKGNF